MLLFVVTMNIILWLARVSADSHIVFVYLFVYCLSFDIAFLCPIEDVLLL